MLVSNAATPFAILALQRFRLADAGKRMLFDIFQQRCNALEDTLITRAFLIIPILFCLFKQNYFHISSMAIGSKLPSAISLSPWRRISTMAGEDMM